MHLPYSPNFPHASYLDERMLMYEPIVKYSYPNPDCIMYTSLPRTEIPILTEVSTKEV